MLSPESAVVKIGCRMDQIVLFADMMTASKDLGAEQGSSLDNFGFREKSGQPGVAKFWYATAIRFLSNVQPATEVEV